MAKISVVDAAGARHELDVDVSTYRAAADRNMSVPAYLNSLVNVNAERDGTVFEQALAGQGMFMQSDRESGIRPPTMDAILNGRAEMNAGAIVRDANPASRILFPAVFLESMESQLYYDAGGYAGLFEGMIAVKDDISGNRFEQPIIDFSPVGTNPQNVTRSQQIGQMSYPLAMVSIKTSDVARKIPTFSIGLEISDEALKATSLPLVTMAVTRQGELERLARIDDYLQSYLWGDKDIGMGDLSAKGVKARTLDSSIAAATGAEVLTHKAWVRWLRRNWRLRHIDWVMCNTNTALAIEARTGRPNYPAQDGDAKLINPTPSIQNPAWQDVKIFLVEDSVLPDGVAVGIDSRYAIRRVRNAEAEYSAVEQFVLKKSQAMRFDFGEVSYRMFDDAWDVLQFGDTSFPVDPRD